MKNFMNILLFCCLWLLLATATTELRGQSSVSGYIQSASGQNDGVIVNLLQNGVVITTATAGVGGTYEFRYVLEGTYVIAPSRVGLTFFPEIQVVTVDSSNLTNQNFTSDCAIVQIVGESRVGYGGAVKYYTNDYGNATYAWSIVGGEIMYGQGTRGVMVVWTEGVTQGTISISGNNACGSYKATKYVSVSSLVRGSQIAIGGNGGKVNSIVVTNNTLYISGSFTTIGPKTGTGVPINLNTGEAESFFPLVNDGIWESIPDGVGGIYIGGFFNRVGGEERQNIARINADGTLHPWNPGANGSVKTLAMGNGVLYVGGEFMRIGGESRPRIAAIDILNAHATNWLPNPYGGSFPNVRSIAMGDSILYVAGSFTHIGGVNQNNIAAISLNSGKATSWKPTLSIDATVYSMAVGKNVVYLGGSFGHAGGVARNSIAAVDAITGQVADWNPDPKGGNFTYVHTLSLRDDVLYVGGEFTNIGAAERRNIAALDIATGKATSWNPSANSIVKKILISDGIAYVGGDFTQIGSQTRNYIAALDLSTGQATNWNPRAGNYVASLAMTNQTVYVGGWFSNIGGQSRNGIAAVDVLGDEISNWNPDANRDVQTLAVGSGVMYAGGAFTNIGGANRNNIAALDLSTGQATNWNPSANGIVHSLTVDNGVVYVGGEFSMIGLSNRERIAALNLSTGQATNWNPKVDKSLLRIEIGNSMLYAAGDFVNIGGVSRNRLASFDRMNGKITNWDPSSNGIVHDITISGDAFFAVGSFSNIGGKNRNNIAALDVESGQVKDWNPNADNTVSSIVVDNRVVYTTGHFLHIGGENRHYLAALDVESGRATDWNPRADDGVCCLLMGDDKMLYAGGRFMNIDGVFTGNVAILKAYPSSIVSVVEQNSLEQRIHFSPTLTDGIVYIDHPNWLDETICEVYSFAGSKVREYRLNNSDRTTIDLQDMPRGLYGLRIVKEGKIVASTVIQVQR